MMVQEPVCHNTPEDIRRAFRSKLESVDWDVVEQARDDYAKLQATISENAADRGDKGQIEQPPCTRCPADIFHVCESDGIECSNFRHYTRGK